jgi:hypothetical protein
MALRQDGEYWYGDTPADVWDYFVMVTRDGGEPVRHWRQAVCKCGCVVFKVSGDAEEQFYERFCTRCDIDVVLFADEFADLPPDPEQEEPDPWPIECICGREEFEVVGVTAPFGEHNPHSAHTFYLGLRCVGCGCLGEYDSWTPRYNDAAAFLAML